MPTCANLEGAQIRTNHTANPSTHMKVPKHAEGVDGEEERKRETERDREREREREREGRKEE